MTDPEAARRAYDPQAARRAYDPQAARRAYKEYAAEAGRRLLAAERARRGLEEAEERRTAAYASVEQEWARLDGLEERAAGVWRELTTRFGPHAVGPLPDPADDVRPDQDAAELVGDAHRRVREPVHYALAGRYVQMAVLGFVVAVVVTAIGFELAESLRGLGQARLALAYGPVLASPWLGQVAAAGWIRLRTSHEEREYAVDTATGGLVGGGGVWVIALIFIVVHFVT
ncbi:hypothetical protein [Actinoallomurus rhizosphaericola]|uniref:hypothetical protein n=1 Tax=Actinoallomurus rhizosphaericola TaxID=2952536 RepID=UPI002092A0FC|nr:hypothetical protein [Actinoallomurus rhizosphaericola]MCO6000279.1 hypothetical protein [Actinoallomurus rhizosphaericola]